MAERQDYYNLWMDNGGDHKRFIPLHSGGMNALAGDACFRKYVELCRERILPGRYRHYKIGVDGEPHYYTVYGVGPHTERKEVLVSYSPDYGEEKGRLCFRPAYMFIETVDHGGYKGPRFVRVW
ncbi:MAG TPA: DUF1653 domain-containing protein [Candidatus Paceibacterota bacterium]